MKTLLIKTTLSAFLLSISNGAVLTNFDFENEDLVAASATGITSSDLSGAATQSNLMNGSFGAFTAAGTTVSFTSGASSSSTDTVTYESLSIADFAWNSEWDVTLSYTDGASETGSFNYTIAANSTNSTTFDFADFTTANTVTWSIVATNVTGNTNVYRFDDVAVNGTVNVDAIPEPTSAALLGLGGLALFVRRKR